MVNLDHCPLCPRFAGACNEFEFDCKLQVLHEHSESGLLKDQLFKKLRRRVPTAGSAELSQALEQVCHTHTMTALITLLPLGLLAPLNMSIRIVLGLQSPKQPEDEQL